MPSPQSSRANLDKARRERRVTFWRSHSESQRVKAEIVWLHETRRELSQRLIARTLRVSQPYVARVLKRFWQAGYDIERAIGAEAYEHLRALRETDRLGHFQAQGAPASLTREAIPFRHGADPPSFQEMQSRALSAPIAAAKTCGAETHYVELARSTNNEVIELHGSKPPYARTDDELQFRSPRPPYVAEFTPPGSPCSQMVHSGIPLSYVLDPRVPRCDLSLWLKAKH